MSDYSTKSYGTAVALAGIFGVIGLHHFYLKNHLHGLLDLGLFVGGFGLIFLGETPLHFTAGIVLILADVIHSLVVFIALIIGEQRDGDGKIVTFKKT